MVKLTMNKRVLYKSAKQSLSKILDEYIAKEKSSKKKYIDPNTLTNSCIRKLFYEYDNKIKLTSIEKRKEVINQLYSLFIKSKFHNMNFTNKDFVNEYHGIDINVKSKKYWIDCNLDCLLKINKKNIFVNMQIIHQNDFKILDEPLKEHLDSLNLKAYIFNLENKDNLIDEAHIVYCDANNLQFRSFSFKKFREYVIENDILKRIIKLQYYIMKNITPNKEQEYCKDCQFESICNKEKESKEVNISDIKKHLKENDPSNFVKE